MSASSASAVGVAKPPWQRSWFFCAPGEVITLCWIAGIHLAVVLGLIFLPAPTWGVVATAAGLVFMGGLGTTVCYHRALAHRGVLLNPVVEQILIFFTVFNGSGNPRTWVAMHRLHHATSDRPDDISSPHYGGFWWAHLRWLWQADQGRSERFAQDLGGFRYRFWGHAQIAVLALSAFGGLLWPAATRPEILTAWLWIGPLRLVWALHAQCAVNSICHLGQMTDEGGSSRNVWWLTWLHLGQGENWHANHHNQQVDPRLGYGSQLDIGWWTIRALRVVGLASAVRDPRHRRDQKTAMSEAKTVVIDPNAIPQATSPAAQAQTSAV